MNLMQNKGKKNEKGFTLIEMMVVIGMIGILAVMMVPAVLGFLDKANESNMNVAAAGLGRGVEAVLMESKYSNGVADGIYTGTVSDNGTVAFEIGGGTTNFSKELDKIAGTGYDKGSTIYVTLDTNASTKNTNVHVVYAQAGAKEVGGEADASDKTEVSTKEIGVYGEVASLGTGETGTDTGTDTGDSANTQT